LDWFRKFPAFFFFFSNIRQLIKKPSQLRQLAWGDGYSVGLGSSGDGMEKFFSVGKNRNSIKRDFYLAHGSGG
jgi:hypothetical protein